LAFSYRQKNDQQSDRKYHAIHHKLTAKKPPLHTAFSKTTLKNTGRSGAFSTRRDAQIFFWN
jgi:hypothetical protein